MSSKLDWEKDRKRKLSTKTSDNPYLDAWAKRILQGNKTVKSKKPKRHLPKRPKRHWPKRKIIQPSTNMQPLEIKGEDGPWGVRNEDGELLVKNLEDNASAWRWIDRQEGEPISPAQKRSEYWWKMHTN